MQTVRILAAAMLISVTIYTGVVGVTHGWNLIPVFFGDILSMTWAGQFNLDFLCFLTLSGLWVAWRNEFTALGWLLGAIAAVGGILFLSIYLLILTARPGMNMATLLLGPERVQQTA